MKQIGSVCFQEKGSAHIQGLIRDAVERGDRFCSVTGNWEMEAAVRLPSDFTLVLDGCHLRMQDGVFCNMFVNEHFGTREGDFDIAIEGRGRVILDGGEPNGLGELALSADPERFPGISDCTVNSLIRFAHVDGIRIHGLHLRNQRYWAITFLFCSRGVLRNLDFRSNDIHLNEDGQRVHGLTRDTYSQVLVKNSDGIDLRCGCHDFIIENITGFTEDDTIALTGLFGKAEQAHYWDGDRKEICNVIIRNVNAAAYCSVVRLLNGDNIRLHDILIDGVFDASRDCPHMDRGNIVVRIGDVYCYGKTPSQPGEVYNITVRNVHGFGKGTRVLNIACEVTGLHTENIFRS